MSKLPQAIVSEVEDAIEEDPEAIREKRLVVLFSRAMNGDLQQRPARKGQDVEKLNARHLRMIQMRASGYKNQEIADALDMTVNRVSMVLSQPESQYVLAQLLGYAADDVLDVKTRVKAVAGEMVNHIVDVTRNTKNDKLKSDNAFKLLALAGYSAVEKKDVSITARIEGEQAESLKTALVESMEDDDEIPSAGRFTVLALEAVKRETGNLSDGSTPSDDSTPTADSTSQPSAEKVA